MVREYRVQTDEDNPVSIVRYALDGRVINREQYEEILSVLNQHLGDWDK
jgi:hypothetical protein